LHPQLPQIYLAFEIALLSFGALGLVDDLFGNRKIGGLRGHFTELIKHKRLTTGAAKAIGAAVFSVFIGVLLYPRNAERALIAALLVALSANAINLTDTRPGRSLIAFFLLLFVGMLIAHLRGTTSLLALYMGPILIAVLLYSFDRRALLMLGDVGSNTIGAIAGLYWAIAGTEASQIALLVVLMWFHWWTESHSLSKTIETTTWLKKLDSSIGVRG